MKKIGFLTSGGDCQGLNATMRGVAKHLFEHYGSAELKVYGFKDGYKGLINNEYDVLTSSDFSGILNLGGTILGTSRVPFKELKNEEGMPRVKKMKETYNLLGLDCLVVLGGNGTHKTANLLSEEGLNVVTLPKTIDNDIWGTDMTFGFHSALGVATDVIDRLHSTATSHSRIFIVEVMGHKAGWLTLYAGVAGGVEVILLPEIPYDIDKVVEVLEARRQAKKKFSILAVAEGAISKEEAKMSKKEFRQARENMKYSNISYRIADEIAARSDLEVRVTIPGHVQRGGDPSAYDRVLSTRLGAKAAELIINKQYGYMAALKDNQIVPVPLSEVAGKLKTVPLDSEVITAAREIGISFGD